MGTKRRWQIRALSFLLALIMVLQDGAAMAVRAEEKNIGAVKTVQENTGSAEVETNGKEDNAVSENTGISEGEENAGDQKTEDKRRVMQRIQIQEDWMLKQIFPVIL